MLSVSSILQLVCGVLFLAVSLTADCAEALSVTGTSPTPVGFAGTELEVPIRLENTSPARINTVLFTRLWQQSSSLLQPVAPRQDWWSGQVEAGANVSVQARIILPEVRTTTRFRIQVLGDDGRSLAQLPLIAIPKGWFAEQFAHLPVSLAVYDPDAHVIPALREVPVKFDEMRTVDEAVNASKSICLLVPAASEVDVALAKARERSRRGEATVVILNALPSATHEVKTVTAGTMTDYCDLSGSAGSQYRFITLLQEALRRKTAASEHSQ